MEKQYIKAKAKEFVIEDPDQPFKDDKLGRKDYAEILTGIVETFVDGAVIALNGPWGTGKTSFLKMWSQHLKNQDFPVIYYNAWEDDISDEPLLSMLRGMKVLQKEEGLDRVFKTGAKVFVGAISGALTAASGIWGGIVKGAVEGGMEQLEASICDSLKKDDDRKELLCAFKESLTDYMTTVCDKGKPLVYMVDELDRCNPSFAVKVLERIKHLFDVPNIVFVLAVDKRQLACSVKGFYGSNEIDAEEYLRRFIDVEYNLPEPNVEQFCDYLYEYFDFEAFLKHEWRLRDDYFGQKRAKSENDKNDLLSTARAIAAYKHLSLRQIERLFAIARIGLCGMHIQREVYPSLFLFLSYLKISEPDVFEKMAHFEMGLQDFIDVMEQMLAPEQLSPDTEEWDWFNYLMGIALGCYYMGYREYSSNTKRQVVKLYDQDKLQVNLRSFDQTTVNNILKNYRGCDISIIIKRLMLLEKLMGLPQTYGVIKRN